MRNKVGFDPAKLALLAGALIETKEPLSKIADRVFYTVTPQEVLDELEAVLLTEKSLFRCSKCEVWYSTLRIDPDKEEWCIHCARGGLI